MKGVFKSVLRFLLALLLLVSVAAIFAYDFISGGEITGVKPREVGPLISVDYSGTFCSNSRITLFIRNIGKNVTTADHVLIVGIMGNKTDIPLTRCGPSTTELVPHGLEIICEPIDASSGTNKLIVAGPENQIEATIFCIG